MRIAKTFRGVPVALLAVAGCAVALGACGSSANTSTTARVSSGIEFAACMRAHGVPNFPDPPGGGGGIQIPAGSGINPASPAFQSAQTTCFKLMPGPGPGSGSGSETRKVALLKLARCMRAHGLTTFPDPTTSPPPPPTGGGIAFGSPGSFIAVPQSMMQSPGFQQAAAECGFPGGGRPPKAAPAGQAG